MIRLPKAGFTLAALILMLAAMAPPAAAQLQIFSTGGYGFPETISLAPGGFGGFGPSYFIPDPLHSSGGPGVIWTVPIAGGPPTPFATGPDEVGFRGGLFLPSGWGADSGRFLVAGIGAMLAFDSAGHMTLFDPASSGFTTPLIAPAGFGSYGGHLFVSDQFGFVWRADPAGGGLTVFTDLRVPPFQSDAFGLEFTPPVFGSFGNRLMVSDGVSGSIAALAPDGTGGIFTTVTLAAGQTGLRQMLMAPDDYFYDALGIHGPLLLLSITAFNNGNSGTLGALDALDSTGAVVAHLRTGGVLAKFDPRGMIFTADGHILISDTSDPIYLASASDFIAGPAAGTLTALSPAHLWVGLKNSDDQGTQFDLKVEFLRNGTPVASGIQRCIIGVTRNPDQAKEAVASFDPFDPVIVTAGDVLSLKVSARVGTNPDGSKCTGPGGSHNSGVGLRLYYDAANRPSRFDATITPNPSENLYLHSNGGPCPNGDGQSPNVSARTLDTTAPTASTKCKDSGAVNFAGGNPFSTIGTWSLAPLP